MSLTRPYQTFLAPAPSLILKKCWFFLDTKSHKKHLSLVLEHILAYNLTINLRKGAFFKESVFFLGNIGFKGGQSISPEKKAAIRNFQTSCTLEDLLIFIETCKFLKNFTPRLSEIAAPLYAAAACSSIEWNPKCQQEFNEFKALFLKSPVLLHADNQRLFILTCDASNFAIASVILQADGEGVERLMG